MTENFYEWCNSYTVHQDDTPTAISPIPTENTFRILAHPGWPKTSLVFCYAGVK